MACEADCEITRRRQNLDEDFIAEGMPRNGEHSSEACRDKTSSPGARALGAGRGNEAGDEKPLLCSWKHACELPEPLLPLERARATLC